jgi:hypothetical protein
MNWRLDFAKQLAVKIRAFAGLRAIVAGGSVVRGYADAYSDLELLLFWDALPDDDTRHALIETLQADFLYEYNGPSQEDQLLIHNFQVDLWHLTLAKEEAVLQAVLQDFSTDLGDSNFMDTLRSCIPLHGEPILQDWKQRAQQYPAELAVRNITKNISTLEMNRLAISAYRDNPHMLYSDIVRLQQSVFLILLALNGEYFPTYKWIFRSLAAVPIKPPQVGQRFRRMFASPYDETITDMRQIMSETLDLVERHYPGIDTSAARRRLAYVRIAHTDPVRFEDEPCEL